MTEGYIKLYRKSIDNGWLRNHELWAFWCWCLLKATHKDCIVMVGYQRIELKSGQFIFGRKKASEELELSERKIRTCLDSLRKRKNVTIKTTNKFSIITVINWDTYQTDNSQNDQQNDQPLTSNRPATDHKQELIRINKNGKKKETPLISPQGENQKIKLLDFVFLTQIEKQKLIERFGEKGTKEYIERLNNYLGSKGKKYKSHYFTILNWAQKDGDRGANNGFRKLTEYEAEMFKTAKMALEAEGRNYYVNFCKQQNLKIEEVDKWISLVSKV